MKKRQQTNPFRYSEDEAADIKREEDDVLTAAELNRLGFLAEHPELADPLIGLLPEGEPGLGELLKERRQLLAELRAAKAAPSR